MKFPPPPSVAELATPDFGEFCAIATSFFATVDPDELVQSITYDDLAPGLWRPFGFTAIHLLPDVERDQRQLRLHVWPGSESPVLSGILPQHPHLHGAHLAGLAALHTYTEQMVISSHTDETHGGGVHTRYTREGGDWRAEDNVRIVVQPPDTYEEGSMHAIAAHDYHKTVTGSRRIGVTFVLRGRVFYPESCIQPADLGSPLPFPPPGPLPEHSVRQILHELDEARQ